MICLPRRKSVLNWKYVRVVPMSAVPVQFVSPEHVPALTQPSSWPPYQALVSGLFLKTFA
ncbi:hypothetical protein FXN61_25995 [Lentzea sp. PSKA42]|uniref:Uncharacterized protein n=1 Tax=Lentzea indica TaxID=2604800 RepID=A0ABX1FM64_9PSEU|nr:hypothetical protein [Lentzea indica]NKE60066.1 hypothetical protein [Lentzea indica]